MSDLVLITGCSGFIAAWVAKYALDAGYRVRGTVRDPTNEKKTKYLRELPGAAERLELVALDLEKSDQAAFDKAAEGCTFILHTASPVPLAQPKDENELIKPAVNGTILMLRGALKASTVKRVVITSSVAAIGSTTKHDDAPRDDKDWTDATDPKVAAYPKSKTLAEKAAWDFVAEHKPSWTLCTINPTFVLGPSIGPERTSSAELGIRLLNAAVPLLPNFSFGTVDVRDVAMAHIKALRVSAESVNGRRFILYNETFWFKQLGEMVNKEFGSMGYKAPTGIAPYFLMWIMSFRDPALAFLLPRIGKRTTYDNKPSRDILGIDYKTPEVMMRDYGHSLIYFGHAKKLPGYVPPTPDWKPENC